MASEPLAAKRPQAGRTAIAYTLLSSAFAIVLLVAAGLKAQALIAESSARPSPESWTDTARWAAIAAECLVATWLLSGIWKVWARRASLVLLTVLVSAAGWHLYRGDADCGCFGRVAVPPAWTTGLDSIALVSLWWFGRARRTGAPAEGGPSGRRVRLAARVGIVAVLAPCALIATVFAADARLASAPAGQRIVVLDPQSWPGHPFPLMEFVDATARADLATARCTVVLYSRHCPKCREYLARVDQGASPLGEPPPTFTVDLAPAAARGEEQDVLRLRLRRLSLRGDLTLVADVPLEVMLRNGVVERVTRPD